MQSPTCTTLGILITCPPPSHSSHTFWWCLGIPLLCLAMKCLVVHAELPSLSSTSPFIAQSPPSLPWWTRCMFWVCVSALQSQVRSFPFWSIKLKLTYDNLMYKFYLLSLFYLSIFFTLNTFWKFSKHCNGGRGLFECSACMAKGVQVRGTGILWSAWLQLDNHVDRIILGNQSVAVRQLVTSGSNYMSSLNKKKEFILKF